MTSKNEQKRWYQDWLGWVIFISIAYGILCLLSLASDVGRPFPGFFTYYNNIYTQMDVEWNIPSWWWDDTGNRPRLDDLLLQVNQTPFAGIQRPVAEAPLYAAVWNQGQTDVTITVKRSDQIITFTTPLKRFSWTQYIDLMLLPVIVGACYWLLALILYRAAEGEEKQRLVVLVLCAIAILAAAVKGSLFIFGSWRENIILYINPIHSLTATLMGPLLIHLAFRFPFLRWPRAMRFVLPVAYTAAFLLWLFYVTAKIMIWQQIGAFQVAQWLDKTWYTYFQPLIILGVACVLARMLGEALLTQKSRERQEARILLAAFILFLPTVCFAIHGVTGSNGVILFLQSLADTRFLSLVVPFAFAAISLRYHTFAGAENWLLLALIVAISGFLANVGTAVLFWQQPQIIRSLPLPPTAVLFILFLLISLIWGWQSGWRGWLGRVFQWERVSYHEVLTYGSRLSESAYADERQLAQGMTDALCAALGVVHAAIWLPDGLALGLTAVSGTLPENLTPTLQRPAHFPATPLRLAQNSAQWLQPCYPETAVILPLTISGKTTGLIGLGPRWDTAVFDDRDLEILDLIAQQSAIFLQNARQTAQLRQTDQQLLHIQELTRQKTAQNLHDHLLPALSQLQLKLLTANQLLDSQPDQAHTLLAESQAALRENANLVRRIQKDLVIRPLEFGLAPYLQELVAQFHQDTGIPVNADIPATLDTIITDISIREPIYAVWQQALDNIQQHAQATAVTATLSLNTDQIAFSIYDNGRGSSSAQQEEALKDGHFGLRSMQIRLESVGGQFSFQSTPGTGSCVKGQIPIPNTKKAGLPEDNPT